MAFAQLNEHFTKLEKSLKHGKKKSSRKKKRYDSSDNDSDSEKEIGPGSTGEIVGVVTCSKSKKIKLSVNTPPVRLRLLMR